MIRSIRVVAIMVALLCPVFAQTSKVESVLDMQEFVHDWTISKQFTLAVANAMPAELYSFKPNPDEMTFGEQIIHIAGANVFRFHEITGIKPPLNSIPLTCHQPTRPQRSRCSSNHSTT